MVINQNGYVKIIDNGIQLAELPEKVVFPEDYKRYRNQVKSEGSLKYSVNVKIIILVKVR